MVMYMKTDLRTVSCKKGLQMRPGPENNQRLFTGTNSSDLSTEGEKLKKTKGKKKKKKGQSACYTNLNLHKVDGLHQPGLGCKLTGIESSASCGNNLTTSTMNGICMQGHVMNVEANGTHVLFTEDTL